MVVGKDRVVYATFVIIDEETQEVADRSRTTSAHQWVHGSGQMPKALDEALEGDARAEADARGRAVREASEATGSIVAADAEKWVTVRPGNWRSANPQTSLVVLAPRREFQGRVVDAFGFGVEGGA